MLKDPLCYLSAALKLELKQSREGRGGGGVGREGKTGGKGKEGEGGGGPRGGVTRRSLMSVRALLGRSELRGSPGSELGGQEKRAGEGGWNGYGGIRKPTSRSHKAERRRLEREGNGSRNIAKGSISIVKKNRRTVPLTSNKKARRKGFGQPQGQELGIVRFVLGRNLELKWGGSLHVCSRKELDKWLGRRKRN